MLICLLCMIKIEKVVVNYDGVENVKVLFNVSKVKVNFDFEVMNVDDLV